MADKMTTEQVDLRKFPFEPGAKATKMVLRKQHFLDAGFGAPWVDSLVKSRPTLYAQEVLDAKLAGLRERGFTNPNKMIESSPAILGLAFENIDAKLAGLRERGFTNPNKMIESLPAILGLAFENIDAKLAGLRERGFTNPNKMIESSPTILGYAFENIDRRLKMFNKLISHYGLELSAVELMEKSLGLFSSKPDKLWVLVRTVREFELKPDEVDAKLIQGIVISNLEDVLVVLKDRRLDEKIGDFLKRVRAIKAQKVPKDEKRRIIADELEGFEKIKRRYLRGYPMAGEKILEKA